MHWAALEIERLKTADRHRVLALPDGMDFSSNDYLGLSRHAALRAAMIAAMEADGLAGAGGSRLLRGHHARHAALEEQAARFFGAEKTLFFGSGFLANLALFSTLPGRRDAIIFDALIHASVKEGMHAGAAARYRARHNDVESFAQEIVRARKNGALRVFVAVESVYSMDGDCAPLSDLAQIAARHDAVLIVDEAHATGVFGAHGRGLAETIAGANVVTLHTCGKALGVSGALVCGARDLMAYLVNKARSFIYSTAPPPFLAAGVARALQLIDEEPWRRTRVLALARHARALLTPDAGKGSQIVPVILGDEARALRVAGRMQQAGFDVRAVRPPTVPAGTARLRVSIHADHTEQQLDALAATLRAALA